MLLTSDQQSKLQELIADFDVVLISLIRGNGSPGCPLALPNSDSS